MLVVGIEILVRFVRAGDFQGGGALLDASSVCSSPFSTCGCGSSILVEGMLVLELIIVL